MGSPKTLALAFIVGGVYAVVGQVIMTALGALLGADFPYLSQLTLLALGVVAFAMYVPGLHQKIADVSGFGSILPFNGFACGVADAYQGGAAEKGAGGGALAAVKLVLFVVGIGGIIDAAAGAAAFFI